jgi:hypothetical protein
MPSYRLGDPCRYCIPSRIATLKLENPRGSSRFPVNSREPTRSSSSTPESAGEKRDPSRPRGRSPGADPALEPRHEDLDLFSDQLLLHLPRHPDFLLFDSKKRLEILRLHSRRIGLNRIKQIQPHLNQIPNNLHIFMTGGTARISGNSDFYGVVYAPNTDVTLAGNAGFFGATVGKTLTIEGTGDMHYDEDLDISSEIDLPPRVSMVQ